MTAVPGESAFPDSVLVETTLRCPADCVFCPNKKITGRPRDMSWDLFTRVVEDCRGMGVTELAPFVTGEPLASPRFAEAVAYISRRLPEAGVSVYTSGYLLDDAAAEAILAGNVSEVHFSIDGATREVYEAHRRGLAYEQVMANIGSFLARLRHSRSGPRTRVVFTLTPDNEHEAGAFRRMWRGKVDTVDVLPCDGRGGAGRTPSQGGAERMGCLHAGHRTYILTDGSVVACCKDWAPHTVLGNVAEKPLAAIWNSPDYVRLRGDIRRGDPGGFEVCRRCAAGEL